MSDTNYPLLTTLSTTTKKKQTTKTDSRSQSAGLIFKQRKEKKRYFLKENCHIYVCIKNCTINCERFAVLNLALNNFLKHLECNNNNAVTQTTIVLWLLAFQFAPDS